uniref:Ig-like domain-containing protein n=1 Tax=Hucho hucho TaxID=62062 RepID=A0A4W5LD90_9TELE
CKQGKGSTFFHPTIICIISSCTNFSETVSGATITITPNPPIIEGGSVTLTCDAAGFNITREWMKDGRPVSSGDNIILSEDKRVLSIKKRTDSGEYLCRISNPVRMLPMTPRTPCPPSNMEVETLCFGGVFLLTGQDNFTASKGRWMGPCTVKSWVRTSFPQPGH